jgi:hypothetical protein
MAALIMTSCQALQANILFAPAAVRMTIKAAAPVRGTKYLK